MKLGFVAFLIAVVATAPVFAAAECTAGDNAIKACVRQYLIDTSVVIGGMISDPAGGKTKAATEACQYDCYSKRDEFNKKYRQPTR